MAIPVLLPLCRADAATHAVAGDGSTLIALAALGVHTLAMLVRSHTVCGHSHAFEPGDDE
jgi:hypothetical protein